MDLVDHYVSELNALGARYGALAYLLGFSDCMELMAKPLHLTGTHKESRLKPQNEKTARSIIKNVAGCPSVLRYSVTLSLRSQSSSIHCACHGRISKPPLECALAVCLLQIVKVPIPAYLTKSQKKSGN